MSGPAAQSADVLALRGTGNGATRRKAAAAPTATAGAPEMPRGMPCAAQAHWLGLVADMESLGTLSVQDGHTLRLCALALHEHGLAVGALAKGLTMKVVTTSGSTVQKAKPEVAIASDAMRRASSLLQQLGLTPATRARVPVIGKATVSRWNQK